MCFYWQDIITANAIRPDSLTQKSTKTPDVPKSDKLTTFWMTQKDKDNVKLFAFNTDFF